MYTMYSLDIPMDGSNLNNCLSCSMHHLYNWYIPPPQAWKSINRLRCSFIPVFYIEIGIILLQTKYFKTNDIFSKRWCRLENLTKELDSSEKSIKRSCKSCNIKTIYMKVMKYC